MSLLWISGILGRFVNILPANDKYFLFNRENLLQSIQIQFSKKQKFLSQFLAAFLKCILNIQLFNR